MRPGDIVLDSDTLSRRSLLLESFDRKFESSPQFSPFLWIRALTLVSLESQSLRKDFVTISKIANVNDFVSHQFLRLFNFIRQVTLELLLSSRVLTAIRVGCG